MDLIIFITIATIILINNRFDLIARHLKIGINRQLNHQQDEEKNINS